MPIHEGEELLSVPEAVEYVATLGRKVYKTTIYGWFKKGLEHGKASTFFTSREALWRFFNRENAATENSLSADDLQRSREAAKELERAGWKRKEKASAK